MHSMRLPTCGYQFAVCTNKLERLSVRLLDQFELAEPVRSDLRAGHLRNSET